VSDLARKTVSHTAIYGAGTFLRYSVSFLMLPIYTQYLEPADYGVVELFQMLLDFVLIIASMRLGQSVLRHYYMTNDRAEKGRVVGSALLLVLTVNGLAFAVIALAAEPISMLLIGEPGYQGLLALFALNLLVGGLGEVGMTLIQAQQRPVLYVSFSTLKLILQLPLNLFFVVLLNMDVAGIVYASVIAHGCWGAALLAYAARYTGLRGSARQMRTLVGFSWPLVLADLVSFYLVFGDRYFLRLFHDLDEVGVYALAYKFGFLLIATTWTPFMKIWDALRYQIAQQQDAPVVFRKVFVLCSTMIIGCALGVALLAEDLLLVMSAPEFHPAAQIVPIVMAAHVLYAWNSYCSLGILFKGNTLQITYGNIAGAAAITVGYLGLVPWLGAAGAAWATFVGYAARFAWIRWQGERAFPMNLEWGRVGLICAVAIACFGVGTLAPAPLLLSVPFKLACLAVFLGAVFALRLISSEERRLIGSGLATFVPRLRSSGFLRAVSFR
jgi:O-antigen/teichoic acid export membrane protein